MKTIFLIFFLLLFSSSGNTFSKTNGLSFGDIIWQIIVPDNPGTSFQDKQIRSLKQIPDVNNDGINEVIVATENYWTLCYDGSNGNLIWQFSTYFGSINTGSVDWEDAVDISDVNNDGISDVVIGCAGGNEMVYALNGLNGNVLWEYGNPNSTSDGDIKAVSIKYDFNGDGVKDVLVSASGTSNGGRHSAICLNALNGNEIFVRVLQQTFTDDVVATESGGAIGANYNGAPYSITGLDSAGNIIWNSPAPSVIWSLKEIPDVNNDNGKDILGLSGFNASIYCLTGDAGASVWSNTLGTGNNGKIALLDDANGNNSIDFTLSAPQVAYRIDSKTGTTIWSKSLNSSYIRGVDNLGDVNIDGIDDIVFATQLPPRLLVLNGADGNILFDYSFGSSINERGDRAAVLNDINSNGINEFLGGNREGRVICFYGGNGIIQSAASGDELPDEFSLRQNYPNPFNPSTVIEFELPHRSFVTLKVFNTIGKEVNTIVSSELNHGLHRFTFEAENLPAGLYFYTLNADNFRETKRMILIK
ncbi:MAG: PQQ-binding-like beta-propeller repeat protein [Ignavibacteriaceae bacterium]|nr:MAG: T9SS C-terminal target domain-containing protein [Chlorobiota bacterium]MBV6398622.1 hypothetical protein [Ignavibacteria bacterium]MCC6885209.1 PQQ-binding-like beta-propeller repeat protein [Ignavibacteriales bacterium]MCE7952000.1 T9SS C-terminal target domain-containing protein [Chlorobi bacterium CHB7]MDL1886441.1 T9SS type A sorting domain-containing protein [Ignavibacteria bacterium CHB1]MEB2330405.1 PQQ-binding-like beta-propeller repeat protein [Ignavibacteriaceae bacterium]R